MATSLALASATASAMRRRFSAGSAGTTLSADDRGRDRVPPTSGWGSLVNTESSVSRTPSAWDTVASFPSRVRMPSRMLTECRGTPA
jgi:hypothetical protein